MLINRYLLMFYRNIMFLEITKIVSIILLFHCILQPIHSQANFLEISDTLNKKRLYTTIGIESSMTIGSMVLLNEVWYKQQPRSSFHLFNDGKDWLQMDKVGHAMTSYYISNTGYKVFNWTGLNKNKSILYGGLLGLTYLTTLEILDGFSTEWGFSIPDMISNTAGIAFFMGQQYLWNEQRIKLKFSAHLTSIAQYRPQLLGSSFMERILKDYNGQTYWISANIHDFLNENSKFPNWINLAIGYGADGMTGGTENKCEYCNGNPTCLSLERQRQLFISFDLDLTKIKWKNKFMNSLSSTFGFIKFPFPTLEISNNKANFHIIYF